MVEQAGLSLNWLETLKAVFPRMKLMPSFIRICGCFICHLIKDLAVVCFHVLCANSVDPDQATRRSVGLLYMPEAFCLKI